MTQQITVVVKTSAAMTIASGVVSDAAGNLWDLPASVVVPSALTKTVTATADAANPNAPFPGSDLELTIENAQAGWLSARTPDQLTQTEFVTNFPEFASVSVPLVNFWLEIGYKRLPEDVWGDLLDEGVSFYAAHNIALQLQNQKQATNGGQPGQNVGPLNSKSVDKVSAGYDTGAGTIDGGGNYNLTNYGTRFLELVNIVGVVGNTLVGLPQFGWPGTAWVG